MIVTPQSNLQIMRGIPWTNDGKHTRYFTSLSNQNTYMQEHVIGTLQFSDCSYIREQNVLRVPVKADDLYNCNYLRYMNNGFGSKWFYAFITDVKYVNTETSEISFEIDQYQTWWFDAELGSCYVEREHVDDDTIGKHIVDEGLGTGDVVPMVTYNRFWTYANPQTPETPNKDKGMTLMLQIKPTLIGEFCKNQNPFEYDDNQIVPHTEERDAPVDYNQLNTDLKVGTFTGAEFNKGYMFPYELRHNDIPITLDDLYLNHDIKRPSFFQWSPSIYKLQDKGYTPKNNKLFTYPYTYLLVTSSDGHKRTYKWENTLTGYVTFRLDGCGLNIPSCSLMPYNYYMTSDNRLDDVPISEFPEVSLGQYDSFSAKNLFTGLAKIIGDVATQNAGNLAGDIIGGAIGIATDTTDKDFATVGNSTLIKKEMIGYSFYVMGIYGQNAKVIDDYLTRFGYKVNTIKIPALTSRKRWNFVKTRECELHAKSGHGVPTEALQKIQDMFNAGVTLWHVDDVGNFSGDNGIVS